MSPQKYRDRIYFAAVRFLETNGVRGDFTGSLDFYEAVDAVLEEMTERDVDAGRFNRKAPRDTQRQLAVIDRKLASIQCGSGTGETCDCLICSVRWMRAHLAASEAAVATLRQALSQIHMDVTQTVRDALAVVPAPAALPHTKAEETCTNCGHSRRLHHFDKACANGRGANWRQADAPVCECQTYVAAPAATQDL